MVLQRYISRLSTGDRSPLVAHLPTVGGFLLALLTGPSPVVPVTSRGWIVAAVVLLAIATALAAWLPWSRLPPTLVDVVPLTSIAAVVCLRLGTGGLASPYWSLLLLPYAWLALREGVVHAFVAVGGATVASLIPILADGQDIALGLVRVGYSLAMYLILALVLNAVGAQLRGQLAEARESSRAREVLLARAVCDGEELRRRQARLEEAHRLMTEVWNAITEQPIIATDLSGRIETWNPGARIMLGLTEEEVVSSGMSITRFVRASETTSDQGRLDPPTTPPGFATLVGDARGGTAVVREYVYLRADGGRVPVQVALTTRHGDDDQINGYLFVATDMTRAQEVARLKDEFLGLVSHELRTPLGSILGYLELLRDDGLSEGQLADLAVVERNAQRLLTLVTDLLFTAQVDAGGFPVERRDTDLGELLDEAVLSAEPRARGQRVTVALDRPRAAVHAEVDPVRIAQAVDNLLTNAIKFSGPDSRVTLVLRDDRPRGPVRISVADSGVGIPAAELDHLANRFFRASSATRNAIPGIGLGLTITKAIAQAHGGRLTVESRLGEGTVFTIELPPLA